MVLVVHLGVIRLSGGGGDLVAGGGVVDVGGVGTVGGRGAEAVLTSTALFHCIFNLYKQTNATTV